MNNMYFWKDFCAYLNNKKTKNYENSKDLLI